MIFWVTSGQKYKRNICDKEQHISSYLERHEIFKFATGRVLFLLATQNFLMFPNKNTDNQTISCKYVYKKKHSLQYFHTATIYCSRPNHLPVNAMPNKQILQLIFHLLLFFCHMD